MIPFWHRTIAPAILDGHRVLVVAHGNSIRALVKHLDLVPDDEIPGLNIPTGFPLVYELDGSLLPLRHYYLGDPEEIRKATSSVDRAGGSRDPDRSRGLMVVSHGRHLQGI